MANLSAVSENTEKEQSSDIKKCEEACKEMFERIVSYILEGENQEAHKMEESIFRKVMELGKLLLQLYFASRHEGNYGETIETAQGTAERGRTSEKTYFSIFGKLKAVRYLYHIGDVSFAPLDIALNLPVRCYSYFLSEFANLLNINGSYEKASELLKKFFGMNLYVSALETVSDESSDCYKDYYDFKNSLPKPVKEEDYTVVSFDGKGVPMIKKEAAKIKAKLGKGEKRQKKKEALVGAKYNINANIRTPEEVATNPVYPDKKDKKKDEDEKKVEKAQNIRYIASVEKPKKEVMKEIYDEVEEEDFTEENPLICVMDGMKYLWKIFKTAFGNIKNKVLIIDIIHVVGYIWLIAHTMYKEGSDEAKEYVYEKLLLILQGKVASYIMELQAEMLNGNWKKFQLEKFEKVITYLKNNKKYMRYDEYMAKGYPIGSGVVESACSHVVSDRMELSGARWGINGAESILRLRSVAKSKDWEDYWEFFITQAGNAGNNKFFPDEYNTFNVQEKMCA